MNRLMISGFATVALLAAATTCCGRTRFRPTVMSGPQTWYQTAYGLTLGISGGLW